MRPKSLSVGGRGGGTAPTTLLSGLITQEDVLIQCVSTPPTGFIHKSMRIKVNLIVASIKLKRSSSDIVSMTIAEQVLIKWGRCL